MMTIHIKRLFALTLSFILAANMLFLASPALAYKATEDISGSTLDQAISDDTLEDDQEQPASDPNSSGPDDTDIEQTKDEYGSLLGDDEDIAASLQKETLQTQADNAPTISIEAHVQNRGWQAAAIGGATTVGTTGASLRLEAFKINITAPEYLDSGISYSSHVQNVGDQNAVTNNMVSGTTGKSRAIEAITIKLTGSITSDYSIYYRVHVSNIGWLNWAKDGAWAGSKGHSYRAEAMQVTLVKKPTDGSTIQPPAQNPANNDYRSFVSTSVPRGQGGIELYGHSQDVGNTAVQGNYGYAGTTGRSKRLEGISIKPVNSIDLTLPSGSIQYSAHVQNIGWQTFEENGGLAGTTGQSLRIEAIKIQLTGDIASAYSIYYRAHVQLGGWLGWTKDGAIAGSTGYGLRLESIQVALVPKGVSSAPSGGGSATYTPVYPFRTFVDVNLSAQHLFFIKDYTRILDCDIVSGAPGMNTPAGTFSLQTKSRNTTLVGPGYATPVSYWMPFLGSGWGLHDATWQSSFGGSRWLSNGSHGCVNMPLWAAAALYDYINVGDVVYIHY